MTPALEASLARYRDMVRPRIERSLTPPGSPIEGLHDLIADYPGRESKYLRSALCLASCEVHGGNPDDALPVAAAIELLHNALLVHDDVEDDSELRRGQPTLHRRVGVPLAVNTGDATLLVVLDVLRDALAELGHTRANQLVNAFLSSARHTVEGQALELSWRRGNRCDLAYSDYLRLVMKKTCWYTTMLPLWAGMIVAGQGRRSAAELLSFGGLAGAAFQIRDDVLNLVGAESAYGKEVLGDLLEGKRTLLLLHLIGAATAGEKREIVEILGRDRAHRTMDDAIRLRGLMIEHGSIDFGVRFGQGVAMAAAARFDRAVPPSSHPARGFLQGVVPWLVSRIT